MYLSPAYSAWYQQSTCQNLWEHVAILLEADACWFALTNPQQFYWYIGVNFRYCTKIAIGPTCSWVSWARVSFTSKETKLVAIVFVQPVPYQSKAFQCILHGWLSIPCEHVAESPNLIITSNSRPGRTGQILSCKNLYQCMCSNHLLVASSPIHKPDHFRKYLRLYEYVHLLIFISGHCS